MKILLTGARGQIGFELRRTLAPLGQVIACDRATLDLAQPSSIRSVVRRIAPTLIVNAGAYTAVDQAESDPHTAMAVNGIAPGILAEEAARLGGSLIHYSSDYVFDGEKNDPYTELDTPNPINVYGQTKVAGENAIIAARAPFLVFRTSWVYGMRGHNFLSTIRRIAAEQPVIRVVSDQRGSPTWAPLVAEATAHVVARTGGAFADLSGLYHLTCGGSTSWYEFARSIVTGPVPREGRLTANVMPIDTAHYPTPARRPRNSVLSSSLAKRRLGIELPSWQQGLRLCLEEHPG